MQPASTAPHASKIYGKSSHEVVSTQHRTCIGVDAFKQFLDMKIEEAMRDYHTLSQSSQATASQPALIQRKRNDLLSAIMTPGPTHTPPITASLNEMSSQVENTALCCNVERLPILRPPRKPAPGIPTETSISTSLLRSNVITSSEMQSSVEVARHISLQIMRDTPPTRPGIVANENDRWNDETLVSGDEVISETESHVPRCLETGYTHSDGECRETPCNTASNSPFSSLGVTPPHRHPAHQDEIAKRSFWGESQIPSSLVNDILSSVLCRTAGESKSDWEPMSDHPTPSSRVPQDPSSVSYPSVSPLSRTREDALSPFPGNASQCVEDDSRIYAPPTVTRPNRTQQSATTKCPSTSHAGWATTSPSSSHHISSSNASTAYRTPQRQLITPPPCTRETLLRPAMGSSLYLKPRNQQIPTRKDGTVGKTTGALVHPQGDHEEAAWSSHGFYTTAAETWTGATRMLQLPRVESLSILPANISSPGRQAHDGSLHPDKIITTIVAETNVLSRMEMAPQNVPGVSPMQRPQPPWILPGQACISSQTPPSSTKAAQMYSDPEAFSVSPAAPCAVGASDSNVGITPIPHRFDPPPPPLSETRSSVKKQSSQEVDRQRGDAVCYTAHNEEGSRTSNNTTFLLQTANSKAALKHPYVRELKRGVWLEKRFIRIPKATKRWVFLSDDGSSLCWKSSRTLCEIPLQHIRNLLYSCPQNRTVSRRPRAGRKSLASHELGGMYSIHSIDDIPYGMLHGTTAHTVLAGVLHSIVNASEPERQGVDFARHSDTPLGRGIPPSNSLVAKPETASGGTVMSEDDVRGVLSDPSPYQIYILYRDEHFTHFRLVSFDCLHRSRFVKFIVALCRVVSLLHCAPGYHKISEGRVLWLLAVHRAMATRCSR